MGVLSRFFGAGWSSPVAHQAHNLKVAGSNPAPATNPNLWNLRSFRMSMEIRMFRLFPGSISGRLGRSSPFCGLRPNPPAFRRMRKDGIRKVSF